MPRIFRHITQRMVILFLLLGGMGLVCQEVQAANAQILVKTTPSGYGTVKAGNSNYQATVQVVAAVGSKLTLYAKPNTGYKFVKWEDNSTAATRTVTVPNAKSTTYTATFAVATYTITATSNNTNYGTVTGGGTYNHGASATLTATPKTGYHFVQWNDGNTNATRTISNITANATYTATFAINTYTLTVTSNNTNYGTVTGGGTYNHGATANLKATPKTGYHFVQWSDGNKNASRTVTATANATYTATFAINQYTIKFVNNGTTLQTLTVNHGVKPSYTGSTPTKTATAQYTYTFSGWSPTIVAATADATYTAQFSSTVRSYTIRFLNGSSVLQSSSVKYGTTPSYTGATPTKSATAQYTYTFSGWSPTIYAVNKAQDYTAQFSSTTRSYKITGKSANTNMGTVSGTATKQYGQTVTLTATPKDCYKFVQWNDGNTTNPRTVTVQGTATYTATFEETISGTCGTYVRWYLNECTGVLRIEGTGAMTNFGDGDAPWYNNRTSISSVTIASGVTSIGSYAFYNCSNLSSVSIPASVTAIGNYAFRICYAMESLYITDLAAWCNIRRNDPTCSPFYRNEFTEHIGGGNLYVNGTKVTTLTIPNGITAISNYAFLGFAGITSIQFNQATSIGDLAFSDCHGLTNVTIPSGVTTIGVGSFEFCTHLQSMTIPASVTSLGTYIFFACGSLTDIYVSWTSSIPEWPTNFTNKSPQSIITLHVPCGSGDLYRAATGWKDYTMQGSGTSNYTLKVKANNSAMGTVQIDDDAAGTDVSKSVHCEDTHTISATGTGCHYFKQWNDGNTENPRTIGISANKTYIAEFAEGLGDGTCGTNVTWYLSCDGVMTISGTGAMTNYGSASMLWYAFKNDIKSVVINSGVTSIGNYAFYNCINLTSVTIPSTVTTIRQDAFENCTSLTSVTIPSSVTSIGSYAFYNTGLTDIYVSWSTAEAIPGWSAMTQASQADNITLHVPCGSAEYYMAKAGWKTYTIRGGCNTTYTLTVASNNSTYGLVQIDKGTPAASITEQVYTDDSHRITAVPVDACHHFVQWEDGSTDNPRTVMPNTNTTYTATFTDQPYSGTCGTNLTWVLECDSTLRISGTGAMTNFGNSNQPWYSIANLIKHVVIEEGVTSIGNNAFYQMDIVTVTNPSTLKTIGSTAFYRCHQLESINFPNGMTSIGNSVTGHGPFYECTSLKAIYIPASLTFINSDTFLRCYSLTSIVVDPANPKYDSRDNCNAIIETATNKLWYGCQTTVIPDGVITVAQFAFEYQHNLKSIRISNTVTHFETYVFKECENLKDIYVEWTTTPPQDILTSWYEHENLDATITIHVPCGYESLYSSSTAWNRYQIADDHLKGGMCGAQGSNQTWMLSCDGHLDIKGIGAMADYSAGGAPWNEHKDAIHTVTLADGINTIGENAFAGFTNLTDIYAPWKENIPVLPASNNPQPSVTLHVPCSAISAYQAAGWGNYTIAPEYTASGTCGAEGDNLTWTLCDSTLTISGSGAMADWVVEADCPWYQYRTQIYTINIDEGVTTIGAKAFVFSRISSITIPNSVTSIGRYAFCYSNYLEEIVLPEGLISIGDHAFYYGNVLKTVHIPSSVTSLGMGAFEGCELKDIYVEWQSSIPEWPTQFSKQNGVNLHVPCGTEALYQDAANWKKYTIEAEGGPFTVTVTTDDASMGSVAITVP